MYRLFLLYSRVFAVYFDGICWTAYLALDIQALVIHGEGVARGEGGKEGGGVTRGVGLKVASVSSY